MNSKILVLQIEDRSDNFLNKLLNENKEIKAERYQNQIIQGNV